MKRWLRTLLLALGVLLLVGAGSPGVAPRAIPAMPGSANCTGGCYSSPSNCQRNCGHACVRVDPVAECGWPAGYVVYRCCAGEPATVMPTKTPGATRTPHPASGQPGIAYQSGGFAGYPTLSFSRWYNYMPTTNPERPNGVQYVQVIRLKDYVPSVSLVQQAALANPGSVWIIGNEPDERSQDYMTPDAYAQKWRYWSGIIKAADPRAALAFGPIAYMDRTWWLDQAIAAHVKRYGAAPDPDILAPHGYGCKTDAACFASRLVAFRHWMKAQGWQDRPLWVAEYGVLGWTPEASAKTFMVATWDAMRMMADSGIGYAPDGYRLVQAWFWFSGNCAQSVVQNAALYNGKALSVYGQTWADYWGR